MAKQNSYSFKMSPAQQKKLTTILRTGNYLPVDVPHTSIAAEGNDCRINLYNSGKCLVQGKGSKEFVEFVLEPLVLLAVVTGYEDVLDPEMHSPHMGIDESGKGDFFGPLVIAAAYTDEKTVAALRKIGVKDSKAIKNDKKILGMARDIREVLNGKFAYVRIGPAAYNRLYSTMRNVNQMLAWGHARAIEDLLEKVPECPRALSDKFGPARQIEQALFKKGRTIKLEQRPRAESDPAVAAASILARAAFVRSMDALAEKHHCDLPKGASAKVKEAGGRLVRKYGPEILLETAKCHFKTTDQVLLAEGHTRMDLGPAGQAVSKTATYRKR